jgi:hypothetical protein
MKTEAEDRGRRRRTNWDNFMKVERRIQPGRDERVPSDTVIVAITATGETAPGSYQFRLEHSFTIRKRETA